MASELSDLTAALNKMEVSQKEDSPPSEKKKDSPPSKEDPPPSEQKASSQPEQKEAEEKEPSPPQPAAMEEATYVKGGGKQEEETAKSPPKSEDAKKSPPPPTGEDTDLLEFTSATEGEGSSSAWELVPEKRVSRKKGVNSDSELDHLVKKVVQEEAEQRKLTSLKAAAITSSSGASSTSVKDVITPIPEDAAAETAEDEGTKAEGEAADKPVVTSESTWQEADFSFEDAPPAPSKESLTSGMGRKNLISTVDNPEDADSEMQDVEPPPVAHLGSKRKERSTSQGSAKKRAISLKSPRAASAGPKSKSPSVQKPVNKIPRASSVSESSWEAYGQATSKGDHSDPLWTMLLLPSHLQRRPLWTKQPCKAASISHRKASAEQRGMEGLAGSKGQGCRA